MRVPDTVDPAVERWAGGTRTNVGGTERIASVVGGGLLAARGLGRGGFGGLVESLAGAVLLYRGATGHCPLYAALEMSTADSAGDSALAPASRFLHVQQSYTVARPADELYRHWRRLGNLPGFMEHLVSVTELSETRSRWVARAPLGRQVEWEAEIVEDVPGERLAWRSVEGSDVANSGAVTFREAPGGRGTEVSVSLEYAPPAGKVGATLAKLFGENPEQQVRDDLRHFKQLLEAGEIPTIRGQPTGRG